MSFSDFFCAPLTHSDYDFANNTVIYHMFMQNAVIDTYIKTLPEKDRLLLGEGMEISDKKALISIIEAYSD